MLMIFQDLHRYTVQLLRRLQLSGWDVGRGLALVDVDIVTHDAVNTGYLFNELVSVGHRHGQAGSSMAEAGDTVLSRIHRC